MPTSSSAPQPLAAQLVRWLLVTLSCSLAGGVGVPSLRAAQTPGVLYGWGDNSSGELAIPSGLGKVIGISAGRLHSLAIQPGGGVVTWGIGNDDRLKVPASLPPALAVAAGGQHSLAIGTNGLVYGWGDDSSGQQTPPAGLGPVVAIAAGEAHSLALRTDTRVVAWGSNDRQQAPSTLNLIGVTAIAAGDGHSLALKQNATVVAWGDNSLGQATPPGTLNGVVAIAAGASHSLALRSDGKVFAWGDNTFGQSTVPSAVVSARAIAAGGNCSMALLSDGTVKVWGDPTFSQTSVPADATNLFAIACGGFHCLAIRIDPPAITTQPVGLSVLIGAPASFSVSATGSDPLQYQWKFNGADIAGATSPTLTVASTKSTDAGNYTVSVANSKGSVTSSAATLVVRVPPIITTQPQDLEVAVGAPATFTSVATGGNVIYHWRKEGVFIPGANFATYAIPAAQFTDAGNLDVVVTNIYGAVTSSVARLVVHPVPVITQQPLPVQSFVGMNQLLSVRATDATGYRWSLDSKPVAGALLPDLVLGPIKPGDAGVYTATATNLWGTAVSAGAALTLVPAVDFSVAIGWGETQAWNGVRLVGIPPPAGLSGLRALAAGAFHGLALRSNGVVWAWGDNSHGEAVPPPGLSGVVGVAAGDGFSLAVVSGGKVVAWGRQDENQTSVPAGLTGVVSLSAGTSHAIALRQDGTVAVWGSNHEGEATLPPWLTGKVGAIAAGEDFNLLVMSNGTLAAWGKNDAGQSHPPAGVSNAVAVAAGRAHGVALLGSGKVVAWGDNTFGQATVPALPLAVIAIAAGADHTVAILSSGEVRVWGKNTAGQREVPAGLQKALAVTARGDHTMVLRQRALSFQPVKLSVNGPTRTARIQVGNVDGTPIDAARAARIQLYASESPAAPVASWTLITSPLTSSGGGWGFSDTVPKVSGSRVYIAIETP
ncbi:MAG TPA: hypothetical protein DCM86_10965 [Verrucomicrobiales bacterium]|nr:hypothetical protein [Verrucomicrobiales bacterium]